MKASEAKEVLKGIPDDTEVKLTIIDKKSDNSDDNYYGPGGSCSQER